MNIDIKNSSPSRNDPVKRLPQLDLLRGVAILMVLGAHPVAKLDEAGWFWPLAYPWGHAGWSGVNLFFVLSGFLVGGLLFAELRTTGRLNPGRFMVRRMFKIWPSYYAYLLIMLAILLRVGLDSRILLPFLFHIQNYLEVVVGSPGDGSSPHGVIWRSIVPDRGICVMATHTWSLAVEEHFYLLLPLVLSVVRSTRVLALLLASCLFGCACSRAIARVGLPTVPTHHNLDSLAFGVLLAYFMHFRSGQFQRLSSRPVVLLTAGVVLVAIGLIPGRGYSAASAIAPVLLYLGYGMILVAILALPANQGVSGRFFRSLPARFLIFVGIYSYSIYVWHIDVAYRLVDLMSSAGMLADASPSVRWLTLMAIYVLLAVGSGALFGRCIELPALSVRDRLFPRNDPHNRERSSLPGPHDVSNGVSTQPDPD
jgi:peptidoglycan/LPS O-acetylase OafA/YrhL